jgi:glycosyltransferase involved in cell wall biosynthesis
MLRTMPANYSVAVLIGCHNSAECISDTVKRLGHNLNSDSQIILIENGSTDSTWEILTEIKSDWTFDSTLIIEQSEQGLGLALSRALDFVTAEYVWVTGDDLPFGFAELRYLNENPYFTEALIIGSKSHPDSTYQRPKLRRVYSYILYLFRRVVLGLPFRDTQGTMFVKHSYVRTLRKDLTENGFLWTTEFVYLLNTRVKHVVEIPVSGSSINSTSRIRFRDVLDMFVGLFRIKRNHG